MTNVDPRKFMARLRREALGGRRCKLFLDMFAGCGKVASAVERFGDWGAARIDTASATPLDLTDKRVLKTLQSWIQQGIVSAMHFAFPCTTWSHARRPALRRQNSLRGRDDLSAADRAKVQVGNATVDATIYLVKLCIQYGLPATVENPSTSMAWQLPFFAAERRSGRCQDIMTDFCQHGARWRKRTRFLAWNLPTAPPLMCRLCSGRGVCSRTSLPHIMLRGCVPGPSLPWTLRAQPYPAELARTLAGWLVRGADRLSYAAVASVIA